MGLFDKKFCDVCGEKIGLLGNRKLEDGNLCKNCAKKLSPFFDERRHSTVEQIKEQLAYREQNKSAVAKFKATKSYGNGKKVYVDLSANKFVVARGAGWRDDNPDVIDFSQVTSVNTDVKEHKREIYYTDPNGERKSYSPRRYEYSYEFKVTINVNSPWFDDINLELSESNRPDSTYSPAYNDLMLQMNELSSVLMGRGLPQMNNFGQQQSFNQQGYAQQNFGQQQSFNQQGYAQPNNMAMGQGVAMGMGVGMNINNQNPSFNNNGAYTSYDQPYNNNMVQPMGMNQGMSQNQGMPQNNVWVCSCGMQNTAAFCQNCGQKKPMQYGGNQIVCNQCGWTLQPGQPVPRFCPNCGDPIDANDQR
ncbi:MAG: DUF4428 domain-containing protein [Acutalibacteraceae bacterium]|nr:DUF4428 domain-containing protein [Acutalibacteraceae bacterium]